MGSYVHVNHLGQESKLAAQHTCVISISATTWLLAETSARPKRRIECEPKGNLIRLMLGKKIPDGNAARAPNGS